MRSCIGREQRMPGFDFRKDLTDIEAARDEASHPSFIGTLFNGDPNFDLIFPFPKQSVGDQLIGDKLCAEIEKFLRDSFYPDEVEETGKIPDYVTDELASLGCFGLKIDKKYGGLGLSLTNYNRVLILVGSFNSALSLLLSAHQSIGVPQPLKLFGTEAQREKYLPLFAAGTISAFALTETGAGSDPRMMTTTATPTEDGKHFLINGEKLWCTNGLIAQVIVVMAVTPPKIVNGLACPEARQEHKQITAFIVETNTPGFEVVHRCMFMGLRG